MDVQTFGGSSFFRRKGFFHIGLSLTLFVMRPFQIIFNPTSAAELAKMPKELQLYILGEFRGLPHEVLKTDMEKYGRLERAGKQLHRFRLGDYRIYFERNELGVLVYRILNRNTLKDFLYRSNFPIREDEVLQQNPKFWELIEAAKAPVKPIAHRIAA
jgi:mRNA-degrading endonuclease RelE of RelBE toxin-antitoxin system